MKLDKLMKYWPIVAAGVAVLVAFGTLTNVVAGNTKVNDKQDIAIEKIEDRARVQAANNARIETQVNNTKTSVEQILGILLENNRRRDDRDRR